MPPSKQIHPKMCKVDNYRFPNQKIHPIINNIFLSQAQQFSKKNFHIPYEFNANLSFYILDYKCIIFYFSVIKRLTIHGMKPMVLVIVRKHQIPLLFVLWIYLKEIENDMKTEEIYLAAFKSYQS